MHRPLQTKTTTETVTKFVRTACLHSVPFDIWVATESDTRTDGGRLSKAGHCTPTCKAVTFMHITNPPVTTWNSTTWGYLGTTLTSQNSIHEDVRNRWKSRNSADSPFIFKFAVPLYNNRTWQAVYPQFGQTPALIKIHAVGFLFSGTRRNVTSQKTGILDYTTMKTSTNSHSTPQWGG